MDTVTTKRIDGLLKRFDFLPPAPQILPKLLAALTQVDTDLSRVVDLIAFDPALTAKLLQTCNSAFFARSRPVDDVAEAVNRLGFTAVYRTVAVVTGAHCLRPSQTGGLDADVIWRHSVKAAFAAQFIGEDVQAESGLLFTAGLLHDIGKVVLATAAARGANLEHGGSASNLSENADLHAEVGAQLLELWKFSAPLAASVRFHHDPSAGGRTSQLAACVALADGLAHHHDQPERYRGDLNGFAAPLVLLGLKENDLARYRGRLEENMQFVETMCRL